MLIYFMGIDGSGKTTYALKLKNDLMDIKIESEIIHFESIKE